MRKTILFLIFLLTNIFGQNNINLTIGPTISSFTDVENSSSKIGISININRDIHLFYDFFFSPGVGFSTRGAILKNRSIAPYSSEPANAYYWDIHAMIGYLDLSGLFFYNISLWENVRIRPFLGPIFTIPVKDYTSFKKRDFFNIYVPGETDLRNYDYWYEQDSGFRNNIYKSVFTFGLSLIYKKMGMGFKYIIDNRTLYYFGNLSEINEKMNSICLFLVLLF